MKLHCQRLKLFAPEAIEGTYRGALQRQPFETTGMLYCEHKRSRVISVGFLRDCYKSCPHVSRRLKVLHNYHKVEMFSSSSTVKHSAVNREIQVTELDSQGSVNSFRHSHTPIFLSPICPRSTYVLDVYGHFNWAPNLSADTLRGWTFYAPADFRTKPSEVLCIPGVDNLRLCLERAMGEKGVVNGAAGDAERRGGL
jgi:hypothetical protein